MRRIGFAGDSGEWDKLEGTPFPFEFSPLGTSIAEPDDDPFFIFGRDNTLEYCRNLGLELPWDDDTDRDFTVRA